MVKNNIKEVRTNKNILQSELAIGSGCSKQTISRYETGERQPCLETALRIAKYLNISTDELFQVDALPAGYSVSASGRNWANPTNLS